MMKISKACQLKLLADLRITLMAEHLRVVCVFRAA